MYSETGGWDQSPGMCTDMLMPLGVVRTRVNEVKIKHRVDRLSFITLSIRKIKNWLPPKLAGNWESSTGSGEGCSQLPWDVLLGSGTICSPTGCFLSIYKLFVHFL